MRACAQDVRTDKFQRLHTLHNLAELLRSPDLPAGTPRTLRDDSLVSEAEEIRHKFLGERSLRLAQMQADFDKALLVSETRREKKREGRLRVVCVCVRGWVCVCV
jgi:hypothetical protein